MVASLRGWESWVSPRVGESAPGQMVALLPSALVCESFLAFEFVLTTFVGACHLETISSGSLGLSLIRRGDEACKEMMGNHFGSVRAALGMGMCFGRLCCLFVLTTFLSGGFIIEEDILLRLAES
jgi:hypothetical protein